MFEPHLVRDLRSESRECGPRDAAVQELAYRLSGHWKLCFYYTNPTTLTHSRYLARFDYY
jgi:hypothetical protein